MPARRQTATLWVDGVEVGAVELADTYLRRLRGLLGRDGIEGAILFRPGNSIHTLGMRFAIDVAHCDADLVVLRTITMARHRLGKPIRGAKVVVEAEAGRFAEWGLAKGSRLRLTER